MLRTYRWRPKKWLTWAPAMVGAPLLMSAVVSAPSIWADIETRAKELAKDKGKISISVSARDVVLEGQASSQQLEGVKKEIEKLYGVRRVDSSGVKVEKTEQMKPEASLAKPTITSQRTNNGKPLITGTWPHTSAKRLTVVLNDKSYVLGESAELTAKDGTWSLAVAEPVADGTYPVTVIARGDGDNAAEAKDPTAVVVDTAGPAKPQFATISKDAKWPYALTGTYAEADTSSLEIKFGEQTYTLGKSPQLKSGGDGSFTFAPTGDLAPGRYEATAILTDKLGNASTYEFPDLVVIPEPIKALPEPTADSTTISAEQGEPPVITGAFPAEAAGLTVTVAGKTYENGKSPNLVTESGTWTLTLDEDVPPGLYPVEVIVTSSEGLTTKAAKPGQLLVESATPPPLQEPTADTTNIIVQSGSTPVLTGTWPQQAKTLAVTVAGVTYEKDKSPNLTTDGANWQLTLDKQLDPGSYPVSVEVTAADGQTLTAPDAGQLVVSAPPPLPAPTVSNQSVEAQPDKPPVLSGTLPREAKTVAVTVAGVTYDSSSSANLKTESGNWILTLEKSLPPGKYPVEVVVTSAYGQTSRADTAGELIVAAPVVAPLEQPTVTALTSAEAQPALNGTWPAAEGNALTLEVAGNTYSSSESSPLVASADGTWTLKVDKPLSNGNYDVVATVRTKDSRTASDTTLMELVVQVPTAELVPEALPEANAQTSPAQPTTATPLRFDCAANLAAVTRVFLVRFDFNASIVNSPYDASVKQVAALMNDPRCNAMKIEIAGHTDYKGRIRFNSRLSSRRANEIKAALVALGVDETRMKSKALGELNPLDRSRTDEARARNRRVEFRVLE
jgi:outer membrane protein OmpA-like peptidoglycan-associated protein/methionine-rich copper-binding protein CopC